MVGSSEQRCGFSGSIKYRKYIEKSGNTYFLEDCAKQSQLS
jgi:hypothetical protein